METLSCAVIETSRMPLHPQPITYGFFRARIRDALPQQRPEVHR